MAGSPLLLRVGLTHPAGSLNQRDYCSGNSQRHAEAVDGTPFASFASVYDSDSADDAASRADFFPVDLHFSLPSRGSTGGPAGPRQFTAMALMIVAVYMSTCGGPITEVTENLGLPLAC